MSRRRTTARAVARHLDRFLGRLVLPFRPESGRILPVVLHSLWQNDAERAAQQAHPTRLPQDNLTLSEFGEILDRLRHVGYHFVNPTQLHNLPRRQRLCLLTFDDGYAANQHVLPLLEQFQAPALFCITTDYVVEHKAFWWDALYRKQVRAGQDGSRTAELICHFQQADPDLLRTILAAGLSLAEAAPETDADRPFRPEELRDFASHDLVTLGNHTASHATLTRCTPAEVRSELRRAQDFLTELTGTPPQWFAYPGGHWNEAAEAVVRAAGFQWAFRDGKGLSSITGVQRHQWRIQRQPLRLPEPGWPVNDWLLGVRSGVRLAQRLLDAPQPVLV